MEPGGDQPNVLNAGAGTQCSHKHSPIGAFQRGSGSTALGLEH